MLRSFHETSHNYVVSQVHIHTVHRQEDTPVWKARSRTDQTLRTSLDKYSPCNSYQATRNNLLYGS